MTDAPRPDPYPEGIVLLLIAFLVGCGGLAGLGCACAGPGPTPRSKWDDYWADHEAYSKMFERGLITHTEMKAWQESLQRPS